MDLGAVRSSWDEYRDQQHRSKRTHSMRTRGELGKANADVSKVGSSDVSDLPIAP